MIRSNRLRRQVSDAAEHGLAVGSQNPFVPGEGEAAAAVRSYIAAATGDDAGLPPDPAGAYYLDAPPGRVLPEWADLSGLAPEQAAVRVARAIRDGARRAREDAADVEQAAEAFLADREG